MEYWLYSGHVSSGIIIDTYDRMVLQSGGKAYDTVVDGGHVLVYDSSVVHNTTVNSGSLYVFNGGSATAIKENGGYVGLWDDTNVTFVSNTISGRILTDEWMSVHSNTIALITTVNSEGYLFVYSGGSAVIRENGGYVEFYEGADVTFIPNTIIGRVLSGDEIHESMSVHSNTVAESTTINRGIMYISSGGIAKDTIVNAGGDLFVSSGGTAVQIVENGGNVYFEDGANVTFASNTVTGVTLSGGYMTVHRNTTANGTINNSGSMFVNGGTAENTVVNSGGWLSVSSGGIIKSTVENDSYIQLCGSAVDTVLNNGSMHIYQGGFAVNTTIEYAAVLCVTPNCSAADVKVNNGTLIIDGSAESRDVSINNSYCTMIVESAGKAVNTRVNKGTLHLYGKHEGSLYIAQGATVSAYAGSTVDFTIAGKVSRSGWSVNDLSAITGDPGYTITISEKQQDGTYKLAQSAENFTGSITVSNGIYDYGPITANGEAVRINGATYTLNLSNGDLTLTIEGSNPEAPAVNILSNNVSQILAWDSRQGKVGYIASDGNKAPKWKGVWEWSGSDADLWRVAGVGHFKGTKVDYDGVLLYNGVGNRFAAWTDLGKGSYGYVDLCKVDGSFNTACLSNSDGNEYDDILIYDDNGSIGVVLDGTTYKDIWHVNKGGYAAWKLEGAGCFDGGTDKLVMVNNYNNIVYLWTNNDTTFSTWNWSTESVGRLEAGWEVAAVGDFEGDGIDDIMLIDRNTDNVWVWDDGNSSSKRWRGTLGEGFEIEAVGDYNGDGKEDLLLREYNTGWGGMGYWGAGYAGNWVDLNARIETDLKSSFDIIA